MALVEALAAVTCEPGVNTTEGMLLRDLLQEAAALGRPLFALFNHPAGVGSRGLIHHDPPPDAISQILTESADDIRKLRQIGVKRYLFCPFRARSASCSRSMRFWNSSPILPTCFHLTHLHTPSILHTPAHSISRQQLEYQMIQYSNVIPFKS